MTRPYHPQVGDLHQQFGPEVVVSVFAVVYVMFKRQEELFLTPLDTLYTAEAGAIYDRET